MRFVAAKKWLIGLGSTLMVAAPLLPAATAYASNPYFKEYGGDVSAGGGFDNGSSGGCVGPQYQDPSTQSSQPSANLYGGILTYANSSSNKPAGGASSQYGAFALGNVDNAPGPPAGGFYSDGTTAPGGSSVGALSFADITNLPWGGQYGGGVAQQDQCIPDYYQAYYPKDPSTAQPFTNVWSTLPNDLTASQSGVYTISAPAAPGQWFNMTANGDVVVHPGTKITIVVHGNVYFGHSVTYAPHDAADTPKFLMVVEGNIYAGPDSPTPVYASDLGPGGIVETVHELDGWYIAQPDPTNYNQTGVFWTCFDRGDKSGNITSVFITTYCNSKLVINGAVTAKQVNLLRINGDVGSATTGDDNISSSGHCGYAVYNNNAVNDSSCSNISEIINYSPDMVVGGGFLNANQSSNTPQIEQLISLPPVF